MVTDNEANEENPKKRTRLFGARKSAAVDAPAPVEAPAEVVAEKAPARKRTPAKSAADHVAASSSAAATTQAKAPKQKDDEPAPKAACVSPSGFFARERVAVAFGAGSSSFCFGALA